MSSPANGIAAEASHEHAPWRAGVEPNGSLRAQVAQLQRARLLHAVIEVSGEHGLEGASVARIVARAGCSRRTFYEHFRDKHACFLAALEVAIDRALAHATPAYRAERRWADKIRAGLRALLEFFDDEPQLARLCFVTAQAGDSRVLAYREDISCELAELVDRGRALSRHSAPPYTGQAVVAGVVALLQQRLLDDHGESLTSLANQLMAIIVFPYLGGPQAGQELRRAEPRGRVSADAQSAGASASPPVRMTGRTLLALTAVAASPGVSNRAVARATGVVDEGQMSKLLRRLSDEGLIENSGGRLRRGEANAWRVTARGRELLRVLERPAIG